jgi:hypothetical protein
MLKLVIRVLDRWICFQNFKWTRGARSTKLPNICWEYKLKLKGVQRSWFESNAELQPRTWKERPWTHEWPTLVQQRQNENQDQFLDELESRLDGVHQLLCLLNSQKARNMVVIRAIHMMITKMTDIDSHKSDSLWWTKREPNSEIRQTAGSSFLDWDVQLELSREKMLEIVNMDESDPRLYRAGCMDDTCW